ncbi:aldehyde dehydrogenase [Amylibacter sp.]|nr:aldehyde dehydrogenase [Amylibacter sp.]
MKRKPHYQLYIDGSWVSGSTNQKMDAQNPANGENWATFDCASKSDVDLAVKSARRALTEKSWCNISQTQRGKLLYKLANLIEENAGIIGQIETNDSGKLLAETSTQTGYVADYYRYYAGLADKIEGSVLPIDKPDMHVFTKREPIGVVVAVVPWNAQMFLTATKLGPALAAGCTVILKASEIAPTPMLEFAKLIDQAGFPPGVVSIITGDAENCSIPLTSHPDIDRIAFTGGPDTARNVIKNSSNNFAVTSLELGGKSPIIVFEDADLESAANGLIAGNFGASGQSCVAGSRGLIHKKCIKRFNKFNYRKKSKNIRVGSPLDPDTNVGPLCTKAQIDNISKTLKISKSQGAKIHFGGSQLEKPGNYMEPTLIECMDSNTETLKVEMFGPIMSLLSFDTEDEAIMFANDSKFGLGSGIFTQNIARAHRVSSKIKAGICWINTYRAISPIAPFGGYNQSGYGREAGIDSIYDYTRTKTIWVNTSDKPMENPFIMR